MRGRRGTRGRKAPKRDPASKATDSVGTADKSNDDKAKAAQSNPSGPKAGAVTKNKASEANKQGKKVQKKLQTDLEKKVQALKGDIMNTFSEIAKEYTAHDTGTDRRTNPGRDVTVTSQLRRLETALERKIEIEKKIAKEIGQLDRAYFELSREIAIVLKGKLEDLDEAAGLLDREEQQG